MNKENQPEIFNEQPEHGRQAKAITESKLSNEAKKLYDFRAQKTLENLETVRANIQNNKTTDSAFTLESARIALKNDIENYVKADNTTDLFKKLRTFYRSRWGRWTRLAVGSGLTVAGLTSLAVGFLPGAFAALAGRVLMSATGSAIVAQELQESSALHAETSRNNIPVWKKALGFLNRKSIEMREEDIDNLSVYEARNRLARTTAQAKSIGSNLSDHKQTTALNLLINRASSIPENRRLQLMRALNNRLVKNGQKANWNELEALVNQRITQNQNLTFRSIEEGAQRSQNKANLDQKNRKKRSLVTGVGFGSIAGLIGLDKLEHVSNATTLIDTDNLKEITPKIDTNIDIIPEPYTPMPSLNAGQYENYVGNYDYPTVNEQVIKADFATTLTKPEINIIREKTLSSELVEKSFGSYDGENLSARLNFATKLHRGDLPIVKINNTYDGKWITYYEDGKNALGVNVADPRNISVKLNDAGEIIDSKVIKVGDSIAPTTNTPTIEIVEPSLPDDHQIEIIDEPKTVPQIKVISEPVSAPTNIEISSEPQPIEAPSIEVIDEPKVIPEIEVIDEDSIAEPVVESEPTEPEVINLEETQQVEVMSEPEVIEPEVAPEPIEVESVKVEVQSVPEVEQSVETQELPKADDIEVEPKLEEVKIEPTQETQAPDELIPQKNIDEATSDEVIPHKSWEVEPKTESNILEQQEPVVSEKVEEQIADSNNVPQKSISEPVESESIIPIKQF